MAILLYRKWILALYGKKTRFLAVADVTTVAFSVDLQIFVQRKA